MTKFEKQTRRVMEDCVFCKIVSGEIPSEILFENEQAVAILDFNPIHVGHILVIQRKHFRDALELEPQYYPPIPDAARIVSSAFVNRLSLGGFKLFSNNGRIKEQSIIPSFIFTSTLCRFSNTTISHSP